MASRKRSRTKTDIGSTVIQRDISNKVPPPGFLFNTSGAASTEPLRHRPKSKPETEKKEVSASEALSAHRVISNPPLFFDAGTTLVVRNLHPDVTSKDLVLGMLEDEEVVSAMVHRDATGDSLGSAEIEFAEPSTAQSAFARLNGHILLGQVLRVSLIGDSYKHPKSDENSKVIAERLAQRAVADERQRKRQKQSEAATGASRFVKVSGGPGKAPTLVTNDGTAGKRKVQVVLKTGGPARVGQRRVVRRGGKKGNKNIVITREF